MIKYAHKISLATLSEAIFQLPEEYKGIIYCIAKNGPALINEITEETERYPTWSTNRWSAKRRIYGTQTFFGLVPSEYLVEKEPNKRRPGKEGKILCLTTKGMLAALSTRLDLDEIYLYKKYIDFVHKRLNIKVKRSGSNKIESPDFENLLSKNKLRDIIGNFIKSRIYVFLIWHHANRIQLQKQISTQAYFVDFYSNVNEYFHNKFPQIKDKKFTKYCRNVLRDNFVYSKILHALDTIADTTSHVKFPKENDSIKQFLLDKLGSTSNYIWYWPYYMEKVQLIGNNIDEEYDFKAIPDFIYSPVEGIDIEVVGKPGEAKVITPRLFSQVKSNLVNLGVGEDYTNELLQYIWDKPHDSFRILETLEIFKDKKIRKKYSDNSRKFALKL